MWDQCSDERGIDEKDIVLWLGVSVTEIGGAHRVQ